ncbi:MAG TPA: Rne/Rng family ribonuclease [Candidatus Omnitrophica bacterium]|nr:Rne/Rng family ribonuclease [Candidatus Omnitrophota bacterium]
MTKEILINVEPREKRVAVVEDSKLYNFFIERPDQKTLVGNIYKGRIETIVKSIGAAFVDIGLEKKGFLYLSEAFDLEVDLEDNSHQVKDQPREFKAGQEIIVQVVKEPFGTKGPRLTSHVSIPGRYLVIMPQDTHKGISRKIENDKERARLRVLLSELKLPKDIGFIVRTASEGKSKKDLQKDTHFLQKLWRSILKNSTKLPTPSLIYEEYDVVLRIVRDSFTEDVTRLIIDSKYEFKRVHRFISTFLSHLKKRVEWYKQPTPLFEQRRIEEQIDRIYGSTIFLKCGGYIIIEPTEGLVVVDVNSGRFKKKMKQEDMAFTVNSEAAAEIARQLRLRDLGGIIVIDFIDMSKDGHRRAVMNKLKRALSFDHAKTDISGMSKLCLVEMTRERTHGTVESLSYETCPHCLGKGKVKSTATLAIAALKEIKNGLKKLSRNAREVNIYLPPKVADRLFNEDKQHIAALQKQFRKRINIIASCELSAGESRIVS